MSIFKRLFSTKTEEQPNGQSDFSEGDIFYTHFNNQYYIYKLLVFDKDFECYHVLGYKSTDTLKASLFEYALKIDVFHYILSS